MHGPMLVFILGHVFFNSWVEH